MRAYFIIEREFTLSLLGGGALRVGGGVRCAWGHGGMWGGGGGGGGPGGIITLVVQQNRVGSKKTILHD